MAEKEMAVLEVTVHGLVITSELKGYSAKVMLVLQT